jgi:hypothetical protein
VASIELGQPEGAQPTGAQPSIPEGDPDRTVIPVNGGLIPLKAAADIAYLQFDWSDVLEEGVTLSSVTHTCPAAIVNEDDETDTDEGTSNLDVSGGVHGRTYQLTIVATLSDASTVTRTWPLRIFG